MLLLPSFDESEYRILWYGPTGRPLLKWISFNEEGDLSVRLSDIVSFFSQKEEPASQEKITLSRYLLLFAGEHLFLPATLLAEEILEELRMALI